MTITALNEREANSRTSSIGAAARSSTATNAVAPAAATMQAVMTGAAVYPSWPPWMSA
ncbi:hypothetical protein [Streptomyces sp. SLBN-31]|uniref:hypothetical protein n=1 Tax=Streptomyces sp. SLBN-31 TaxID=2768444 RepID=UPI001C92C81F|nr:hypothetical protein [Streptomyces sp. SLBN-31]